MKVKNVIGQRFGRLVVLEDNDVRVNASGRTRRYLKCRCDCGNICTIEKSKVLRGATKSCGCLAKEIRSHLGERLKKPVGEAAKNEIFAQYKKSAKNRGYDFNLTMAEFESIITKPCIYCGATKTIHRTRKGENGGFAYTGIDRYDNTKGYTLKNCVPCCSICNRMKTNLSINKFEEQITKILNNKNMWRRTA